MMMHLLHWLFVVALDMSLAMRAFSAYTGEEVFEVDGLLIAGKTGSLLFRNCQQWLFLLLLTSHYHCIPSLPGLYCCMRKRGVVSGWLNSYTHVCILMFVY